MMSFIPKSCGNGPTEILRGFMFPKVETLLTVEEMDSSLWDETLHLFFTP